MTLSRTTLRLRAITPPPARLVAAARPPYVSEAGKAHMAEAKAAYERARFGVRVVGDVVHAVARRTYNGSRWSYALHELARVEAQAEQTRRARRRVWFSRPGYVGLERVVARAFAGLAAVHGVAT